MDVRLPDINHSLVREAQRLPELHAAGGVERILSLSDRVWFKIKTGRWRGAATRLPEAGQPLESEIRLAPWWLGAGGYRREGDPSDFYASLAAAFNRDGSSNQWLPEAWDWKRLELEHIFAWEQEIRRIVRELIARSLKDGHAYQAEFEHYRVTALARAEGGEAYLLIGTDNVADARVFAVIINSIPGIDPDSWLPEPEGVAGVQPNPGEIIWSTILPPAVAAQLLDALPDE